MTGRPAHRGGSFPPPGLDTRIARSARVWNYLMGGKDNFAADRGIGDMVVGMFPDMPYIAQLQHRFLVRVVRMLVAGGIRQFLDIGTGLPAADNTHRIAQQAAPESRVVYVDNDPLVLLHARALMKSGPGGRTGYVEADVRDTEEILGQAARTLDFGQPVALIMLGILGEIADSDDPRAVVKALLHPLLPGSFLALCDGTDTSPAAIRAVAAYNEAAASPYHLRSSQQIAGFFDGLTLLPPGLVSTSRWRPERQDIGGEPRQVDAVCGVGRKN